MPPTLATPFLKSMFTPVYQPKLFYFLLPFPICTVYLWNWEVLIHQLWGVNSAEDNWGCGGKKLNIWRRQEPAYAFLWINIDSAWDIARKQTDKYWQWINTSKSSIIKYWQSWSPTGTQKVPRYIPTRAKDAERTWWEPLKQDGVWQHSFHIRILSGVTNILNKYWQKLTWVLINLRKKRYD